MEKAAANLIKHVSSGQLVPLSSLWVQQMVVIAFVRRWGWLLCRAWASELGNDLKPQLDAHGVNLVLVGVEDFGIEEFLEGNYYPDKESKWSVKDFYRMFVFAFATWSFIIWIASNLKFLGIDLTDLDIYNDCTVA